nr:RecName: Full=GPI-anchored glycoprotein NETNES [Trypanosoma cruzi]
AQENETNESGSID